jgi:TPR repeat protein
MLYAEGRGVERDDVQAVDWFRKAAVQGNAIAQYDLGYAYESGRGVKADAREAAQWFARAASQGHGGAQARLNSLQTQNVVMGVLKRVIESILR